MFTYARRDNTLIVVWIHAYEVLLEVKGVLAELAMLQLVLVQIWPPPNSRVNNMRKSLPACNLHVKQDKMFKAMDTTRLNFHFSTSSGSVWFLVVVVSKTTCRQFLRACLVTQFKRFISKTQNYFSLLLFVCSCPISTWVRS